MKRPIAPRRVGFRGPPRLELLEARNAPGEALLGSLLAAWAMQAGWGGTENAPPHH